MTLPLETINGKQYQPVEVKHIDGACENCALNSICNATYLNKCDALYNKLGINVYFIETGDANEQE